MNANTANEPSIKTIGRNIRRWRELREMKGEDLAHKISINKASLSNIENGKTHLSLQKLAHIASASDLTLQQLISTDPQSVDYINTEY